MWEKSSKVKNRVKIESEKDKKKALKPGVSRLLTLAGTEGPEPSARGFGAIVESTQILDTIGI